MKTSQQWWNEVKADPVLFDEWLVKQYRGEVTASMRIRDLADTVKDDKRAFNILDVISLQEDMHAQWIGDLMVFRGLPLPVVRRDLAEQRYWKAVQTDSSDFAVNAAIGAHAEQMRLERIQAIVADLDTPTMVRDVFSRILTDEKFHARAFEMLAGPEAMANTQANADRGREVLGLEP